MYLRFDLLGSSCGLIKKPCFFHLTIKVQWFDSVYILLGPLIICMLLACIPFFTVMFFFFLFLIFTYNKIKTSEINQLNIFTT
jgi:hypothetical protein